MAYVTAVFIPMCIAFVFALMYAYPYPAIDIFWNTPTTGAYTGIPLAFANGICRSADAALIAYIPLTVTIPSFSNMLRLPLENSESSILPFNREKRRPYHSRRLEYCIIFVLHFVLHISVFQSKIHDNIRVLLHYKTQ